MELNESGAARGVTGRRPRPCRPLGVPDFAADLT